MSFPLEEDAASAQRLAATLRRVQDRRDRLQNGARSAGSTRVDAALQADELQADDLELCQALLQAARDNPHLIRLALSGGNNSGPEMLSPARTLVQGSATPSSSFKRAREVYEDDGDVFGPERGTKRVRDTSPHAEPQQPRTDDEAIAALKRLWERAAAAMGEFTWPEDVTFVDGRMAAGPARDAVEDHEQELGQLMQDAQAILCTRFGREARDWKARVCKFISARAQELQECVDQARDGARRTTPSPTPPTSLPPTPAQPTPTPPPLPSPRGRSQTLSPSPPRESALLDVQNGTEGPWMDDVEGRLEREAEQDQEQQEQELEQDSASSDEEPLSAVRRRRRGAAGPAPQAERGRPQNQGAQRPRRRNRDRSPSCPRNAIPGARVPGVIQANDGVLQQPPPVAQTRQSLRDPHVPRSDGAVVATNPAKQFLAMLSIMSQPNAYGEVASLLQLGAEVVAGVPKADRPTTDNALDQMAFDVKSILRYTAAAWVTKLQLAAHEFSFALESEKMYGERIKEWEEREKAKSYQERRKAGDSKRDILPRMWDDLARELSQDRNNLISWHGNGLRWAYVLYAGSIPAFLAINILELRTDLLTRLDPASLSIVCEALRDPSMVRDCSMVNGFILPTILEWGACFNMKMGGRIFGHDLAADDELITSTFNMNLQVLSARCEEWNSWSPSRQYTLFEPVPLDPERPKLGCWTPPPSEKGCIKIRTGISPVLKPNAPIYRGSEEERKEERKKFTAAQRLKAKASANKCETLEQLLKLAASHSVGEEDEDAPYLVIDGDIAKKEQADLILQFSDGSFMAMIINSLVLPQKELDALWDFLRASSRINPTKIMQDSDAPEYRFPALHLVWSNRYSERGDDLSSDPAVAESMHELEGNDKQRIPRPHRDIRDDITAWQNTTAGLQKLFKLVAELAYLPDTHKVLLQYVASLPAGAWSPCAPFGGLVLNFGVACDGHVDPDLGVCVVITFGEFKGGELGLYEARCLFELKGVSIFVFPSDKFTHFNCRAQGERGSMVLSTEKVSQMWTNHRNYWSSYLIHRKREIRAEYSG